MKLTGTVLVVDPDPKIGKEIVGFFKFREMEDVRCVWQASFDPDDPKVLKEPYPVLFIFDEATIGEPGFFRKLPLELADIPVIFLSTADLAEEVVQSDDFFWISKPDWRSALALAITKAMLFSGQH